jgi:hypothetical protein
MPKLVRPDAPGTLHHVIVRKLAKRRIVDNRTAREAFASPMGEAGSD